MGVIAIADLRMNIGTVGVSAYDNGQLAARLIAYMVIDMVLLVVIN